MVHVAWTNCLGLLTHTYGDSILLVCCHYIEQLQHKPDTHCQHHCFTVCFCYIFKDARDSFCKPSDRSASTTPTKPVSNSSEYLTPVHGRALAYLHNRALDYVHGRALDYVKCSV